MYLWKYTWCLNFPTKQPLTINTNKTRICFFWFMHASSHIIANSMLKKPSQLSNMPPTVYHPMANNIFARWQISFGPSAPPTTTTNPNNYTTKPPYLPVARKMAELSCAPNMFFIRGICFSHVHHRCCRQYWHRMSHVMQIELFYGRTRARVRVGGERGSSSPQRQAHHVVA